MSPALFAAAVSDPHSSVSSLWASELLSLVDSPESKEKTKRRWETCSIIKVNELKKNFYCKVSTWCDLCRFLTNDVSVCKSL